MSDTPRCDAVLLHAGELGWVTELSVLAHNLERELAGRTAAETPRISQEELARALEDAAIALFRFGTHSRRCAARHIPGRPDCDCGLDAVRIATEEMARSLRNE